MTDVKTLWRNQKTEEHVTLANIHDKAATFQKRVRRRNLWEYRAAVFVVVIFGLYAWFLPGWMIKTGSVLSIVAALFVVWRLHRHGAARATPETSGVGLVDFHRRELVRQRDLLRSVPLWYLLPFVPGIVLILMGRWFQFPAAWRTRVWDHEVIILCAIIMVLVLGIVWLLNAIGASRLQRKIDELDRLREGE